MRVRVLPPALRGMFCLSIMVLPLTIAASVVPLKPGFVFDPSPLLKSVGLYEIVFEIVDLYLKLSACLKFFPMSSYLDSMIVNGWMLVFIIFLFSLCTLLNLKAATSAYI